MVCPAGSDLTFDPGVKYFLETHYSYSNSGGQDYRLARCQQPLGREYRLTPITIILLLPLINKPFMLH